MTNDDADVRHNPEQSRYEIRLDGQVVGFTEYNRHDGRIDFLHTEIDDAFEGRGLASTLIRFALDDARAKQEPVVPYCRFVRGFIEKHPDYQDLVVPAR
jgi:hypothetical protein